MGQNPYSPHTDADRAAMLARIGIRSVDELLGAVPADARGPAMGVPAGLSEAEIQVHMEELAALDRTAELDGPGSVTLFHAARRTGRRTLALHGKLFVDVSFGDFPYAIRFAPAT